MLVRSVVNFLAIKTNVSTTNPVEVSDLSSCDYQQVLLYPSFSFGSEPVSGLKFTGRGVVRFFAGDLARVHRGRPTLTVRCIRRGAISSRHNSHQGSTAAGGRASSCRDIFRRTQLIKGNWAENTAAVNDVFGDTQNEEC